jgi:hypothetical protein
MPVFYLRIFYYLSVVFFYVSCSLNIYEWLLIIHRVNFFGGIISRKDYRKHARVNRVVYTAIATIVALINVIIIFADAFDPKKPTSLALTMTITVVFSAMLITFSVVGVILIHRLGLFFKKNYDKQRFSLMTALVLIVLSLMTLSVRYGLEYAYLVQRFKVRQVENEGFQIPLYLIVILLVVSDIGPIIAQMYCMWLAKKGEWNDLISGFLGPPHPDEQTTLAGSVILDDLKDELSQ